MKNKKLTIIITSIVLSIIVITGIILISKNNKNNTKEVYYTITFNSDGGTKIDDIKVKENDKINFPKNPTKEGYEFQGWTIVGEKFTKDMKVEKDLTLTAIWSKIKSDDSNNSDKTLPENTIETENQNNNITNNQNTTQKYTCEDGYTLNGTKCTKTYDAPHRCSEGSYEINGKCIGINISKKVSSELNCKTGTKINIGYSVCKGERISVDSSSSCNTANGIWLSNEGACYEKGEESYSCSNGYEYISNPGAYNQNIHGEAGCYPIEEMRYTCTNSKTDKLEGTKCITTIDAKIQ